MAKHRANGEGTIRKRTDGRWEARYTDTRIADPKKRIKTIISKSQKDVVEKLKVALAEVSTSAPPLVNDNPTLAEWVSFWLHEYKISELRDNTYENYERQIKLNITPLIGHIRMKDLTGLHIQQMYNKLQESKAKGGHGLGGASILKIKNILSGAL